MPWYKLVGERLRDFEIPGWNPYQFSGTPFAADPQSGWMMFGVMIPFALFNPLTAFKIFVAIELIVAAFGTYALARVIRLRPVAALMAAVIFTFGPLAYQTNYCCSVRSNLAAWIPLTLLGIELGERCLQVGTKHVGVASAQHRSFCGGNQLLGFRGLLRARRWQIENVRPRLRDEIVIAGLRGELDRLVHQRTHGLHLVVRAACGRSQQRGLRDQRFASRLARTFEQLIRERERFLDLRVIAHGPHAAELARHGFDLGACDGIEWQRRDRSHASNVVALRESR
jgi:hypothetical protein